ncbi:adenosine deaminase [Candidatus Riflebacteria bacterium]
MSARNLDEMITDAEKNFIRLMPKAELHRHLHGSISPDVYQQLIEKYGFDTIFNAFPDWYKERVALIPRVKDFLQSQKDLIAITTFIQKPAEDFSEFAAAFCILNAFVRDFSDYEIVFSDLVQQLKATNTVYAELILMSSSVNTEVISYTEFFDFLAQKRLEIKRAHGIELNWIFDFIRDLGAKRVLELAGELAREKFKHLVGITLGGSEKHFPARLFKEAYEIIRANTDIHLSVHAGEGTEPGSVWDALNILRVERIGHGVNVIEDQNLQDFMVENSIPIEICITSNLKTGVVSSLAEHPVKSFFNKKIPLIINTDDPAFFLTDLVSEFEILQEYFAFSREEISVLVENSFKFAFIATEEKRTYLGKLKQFIKSYKSGQG